MDGKSLTESMSPGAVTLPCDAEHFTEFVAGLLGRPQTIVGGSHGVFEITRQNIENTYHLVTQRVNQQDRSSLIQFTVRLVFDDNSSVLLNSLADFQGYHEVKPLVATQAHLSWSFLIAFPGRQAPERQDIELSFITKMNGPIFAATDEDDGAAVLFSRGIGGSVFYRIKHTARTWGYDIEALLKGHSDALLKPEEKFRVFLRSHSEAFSLMVFALLMLSVVASGAFEITMAYHAQLQGLKTFLQDPTLSPNARVEWLMKYEAIGYWGRYILSSAGVFLVGLLVSISVAVWVDTAASRHEPSFLMLTEKANQYRDLHNKKYRNSWRAMWWSIIIGIATGVIGNIIFAAYWAPSAAT